MNRTSIAVFAVSLALAVLSVGFAITRKQYFPPDPGQIVDDHQPPKAEETRVSQSEIPARRGPPLAVSSHTDLGPPPEYSWVAQQKEEFILSPGQTASYQATSSHEEEPYADHRIRFDVKSSSGVDAGALDGIYDGGESSFHYYLGSHVDLCYKPRSLSSAHTCRLTGTITKGWILLCDPRPTGNTAALGAVAGAVLGVKEPLRQAVRENRVSLTIYEWKCVNFCGW